MPPLPLSEGLERRVGNASLTGQGGKPHANSSQSYGGDRCVNVSHEPDYYGVPYYLQAKLRNTGVLNQQPMAQMGSMTKAITDRREAFRRFANANGKVAGLSRVSGIPATTLYSYLKGETDSLKGTTEQKLASAFDIPVGDMFGLATIGQTVPIVGYVSAGGGLVLYAEGQGPFDYVDAPANSSPETVAATVKGASLGPLFDAALVFYNDVRSPVTPDLHGRLCVVGLAGGRVLVKLLRPGEDGRFHLISNTAEEPLWNQDVEWAALVTEVRPR